MAPKSRCKPWHGAHRASDGRPLAENRQYAYRWRWEQRYGALLPGVVLHHKCGNVACVNLRHLVPMRQGQHMRLHGMGGDWGQRDKTRCPAGHPYDEVNTYHYAGERHCRACRHQAKLRYRAKQKDA